MSATVTQLRKATSTNSTSSGWTAKVATSIEPAKSVTGPVFWLFEHNLDFAPSSVVPKFLQVIPYASAADNVTLNLRVWGWSRYPLIATPLWIPQILVELAGIVSAVPTATPLGASNFFCDTLTVTSGGTDEKTLGVSVISPGGTTDLGPASALIHLRGCEYIEFDFKIGTATDMNALWRCMDQD